LNERTFRATLNGGKKIRWSHFLISALVWTVISAIYFVVYLKIDPANFVLNNSTISLLFIAIMAVLLIPVQAGLEEVVFRGYLMQGFAVVIRNRFFPLIMTSLFFGLLHSFNPEVDKFGFLTMMPQYVLFGLIFGIITILDDGIESSMGAHAANNIFLVIFVTNEASALQTPALYEQLDVHPWTEFTGLLLSGIAFILVLTVIFRWKDFGMIFRPVERRADSDVID
jgi:membrane protease YdiL (CAAX protease family)